MKILTERPTYALLAPIFNSDKENHKSSDVFFFFFLGGGGGGGGGVGSKIKNGENGLNKSEL